MTSPGPSYSLAELSALPHLDVDALISLMHIEFDGEGFYGGLADGVDHPEAADLLRRNGREEATHGERLIRAISLKLGTPYEPSHRGAGTLPSGPANVTAEYLAAIVTGEQFGGSSYHQWAQNEPDPEVAQLLRQNGREEMMHARRVQQVIDLLDAVPVSRSAAS